MGSSQQAHVRPWQCFLRRTELANAKPRSVRCGANSGVGSDTLGIACRWRCAARRSRLGPNVDS